MRVHVEHRLRKAATSIFLVPFIVVCGVMSVLALGYGYVANGKANAETDARTAVIEQQNERDRLIFCGIFESIGYPPPERQPSTPAGFNSRDQFAAGAVLLGCTPDRTDNR